MGIWSIVHTRKDFEKLKKYFENEIPAKDAVKLLYNYIGDDDLFDIIDEIKKDNKDIDIRKNVLLRLQEIFSEGIGRFNLVFEGNLFNEIVEYTNNKLIEVEQYHKENMKNKKDIDYKFLGF